MNVTIRDVARKARVSVGTVSRVINGKEDVDAALRARVLKVVEEYRYQPSARAQALSRERAGTIGFLVSNRPMLQPFNAWVLNGIAAGCERAGYGVTVALYDYAAGERIVRTDLPLMLRRPGYVDCVILGGTIYPNLLACLEGVRLPFVYMANEFKSETPRGPVDRMRFDHAAGGRAATSYLIELGHRDIWYIGDVSQPWYQDRYAGYSAAMRDAGLEPRAHTQGLSDDRFLDGLHSADLLLDQRQPLTAIVAGTDEVAYGAWEALDRRGVRVPGDVSLIGFEDERVLRKSRPLTTMRVDAEEGGRQLARMAVRKIQAPGEPVPEMVIEAALVKNDTCLPIFAAAAPQG